MTAKKTKWKRWHKIVISVFGGFFILLVIVAIFGPDVPAAETTGKTTKKTAAKTNVIQQWKDSVARLIKQDSVYKVRDVQFGNDTLKVLTVKNKDDDFFAKYFLQTYSLDSTKDVSVCALYSDYSTTPLSTALSGWKIKSIMRHFEKNYFDAWDGSCIPLKKYLKDNMNDAGTYENVETTYRYNLPDNDFKVICKFRGTNAYGAKVLNYAIATVDTTGNIESVKMNE